MKYEGAITSWTPTWNNLTVGNGTTIAEYQRIGNLVFCYIQFTLGSTSAVTGDVYFSLPVGTTKRPYFTGNAYYVDTGTTQFGGCTELFGANGYFRLSGTGGTYINPTVSLNTTVPHVWANTDIMQAYFYYEVA